MKASLVILLFAVVAGFGWWLALPEESPPTKPAPVSQRPTKSVTDPATVFQKAFWKRPSSEDQIIHAERREWSESGDISKWQWFISVKPSPALVDHLITQNAFSLTRGEKSLPAKDAPEWFAASGEAAEIFVNASGTFSVWWDKEKNLLHATDSGRGFRPGAPQPRPALANSSSQPAGRLPVTPPPRPEP